MTAVAAFLLAFPALFSIVNPVGSAFIFDAATAHVSRPDRAQLAWRVGLYSLLVMLGALWAGSYVLSFFGVTIAALRLAGGSVVALNAWHLLTAPEHREARKQEEVGPTGQAVLDMAFFPLTMPFTAGPGTISVAITLGAERPASGPGLLGFFVGTSAAAAAMALLVWIAYRSAGRVARLLGTSGRRTIARLFAFLLLCVGMQILISGIEDIAGAIIATQHPGG